MMPGLRTLVSAAVLAAALLIVGVLAAPPAPPLEAQSTTTEVDYDWDLIPSGLQSGDTFRLLIVTSTTRDAQSAAIANYDAHVQTAVASGHADIQDYSSGFRVLGSTVAVNVREHTETRDTDTSVPIYYLNGGKVADDYAGLYDGSWDSDVPFDESGSEIGAVHPEYLNESTPYVWTGTESDGTTDSNGYLGLVTDSADLIAFGVPRYPGGEVRRHVTSADLTNSLYGLSEVFVVGAPSADAMLKGLALEDADDGETIALSPGFDPGIRTYTASAGNRIGVVKLTATKNDDNAKVVITNDDDQTGSPGEAVLDLIVGSNELTVTVTAEDTTSLTYTVTVERAAASSLTTFVSNTHLITSTSTAAFEAQSFKTGATGGYTVSEVDIYIVTGSGKSTSVKIRANNADNEPGDLVATLTNPDPLMDSSLNTFTASDVITLDAEQTYWITVNEGITSNRAALARPAEDDETGEPGWSIGDGRLVRFSEVSSWSTTTSSLVIAIKGTAIPLSDDARLSALSVSPRDIIGFYGAHTSYEVGLDPTVDTATVSATVNHPGASVVILPVDADTAVDGHQVTLSAGSNVVTVAVTAEDGLTKRQYTVSVNRGVTDAKGWQAGADLDGLIDGRNEYPRGIWSNETTVWVADAKSEKLFAYTLADGMRDAGKDITLDANNNHPFGIWSNGTTMWVADWNDAKLYAYTLADRMPDADNDITLHADNTYPTGIWSNETTMWVADHDGAKLYAYMLSDGTRDTGKEFTLHADNADPAGIWSDETTMWVVDDEDDKLYAYTLSGGMRDADKDITLPVCRYSGRPLVGRDDHVGGGPERRQALRLHAVGRDPGGRQDHHAARRQQ